MKACRLCAAWRFGLLFVSVGLRYESTARRLPGNLTLLLKVDGKSNLVVRCAHRETFDYSLKISCRSVRVRLFVSTHRHKVNASNVGADFSSCISACGQNLRCVTQMTGVSRRQRDDSRNHVGPTSLKPRAVVRTGGGGWNTHFSHEQAHELGHP